MGGTTGPVKDLFSFSCLLLLSFDTVQYILVHCTLDSFDYIFSSRELRTEQACRLYTVILTEF